MLDTLAADAGPGKFDAGPSDAAGDDYNDGPDSPSSQHSKASTVGTEGTAGGTGGPHDDRIDRLLDEFELTEALENANLTDEEGDSEATSRKGALKPESQGNDHEPQSSGAAPGLAAGDVPSPPTLAEDAKQPSTMPATLSSSAPSTDSAAFLSHAFPTRTTAFLSETLQDCKGDVGLCIDTLMAIDLAEQEESEQAARAMMTSSSSASSSSSQSQRSGGGLDYDALAQGSKTVKGKKGRAQRRQAQDEYLRSLGQEVRPVKAGPTKVTLGDVRQGGGVRSQSRPLSRSGSGKGASSSIEAQEDFTGLTDAEIAQRLAKEEDPTAGEPVRDNQWLLTSSVLSQLSTLLEVTPEAVSSTYNHSGFNLHIAVGRLIDASADQYPTLEALEMAGSAPAGTAEAIVTSLASLSGRSVPATSLCLRATKGRQDATLDLLNLLEVVREAAPGEVPDQLDPLGKLRESTHPGAGTIGSKDGANEDGAAGPKSALSSRKGVSVHARADPLPSEASRMDVDSLDRARQAGAFSRAAVAGQQNAQVNPTGQAKAMASLREGSSGTVSFPPSAGQVDVTNIPSATHLLFSSTAYSGGGEGGAVRANGVRTLRDREQAIAHCHQLAMDFQSRRNRSLLQASQAWRSTPNNRGAAFYYADEARKLEAKSRAWSLRAAEELVALRRIEGGRRAGDASFGGTGASSSSSGGGGGAIDLHGVTVREALSIVGQELNNWWSRPTSVGSRKEAMTIITGAGRHSPNQVAILTPSVARYLQREGWRAEVDRTRGVITVRGR